MAVFNIYKVVNKKKNRNLNGSEQVQACRDPKSPPGYAIPTHFIFYYIHGSAHRDSILTRSNKMQQYVGIYYCIFTLYVPGVHRTHHQEYLKL